MKRILLVDNYDSFTYNLVHYLESLHCQVTVRFNDDLPEDVVSCFDGVVLSPGPGLPEESGDLMPFIHRYLGEIPMLGVCLGMQGLALALDGALFNQKVVKHGVQEAIEVIQSTLFEANDSAFQVGLYHSWAISEGNFEITAKTKAGVPMAMENKEKRCFGVQFHPESIMTPKGMLVLEGFLERVEERTVINAV